LGVFVKFRRVPQAVFSCIHGETVVIVAVSGALNCIPGNCHVALAYSKEAADGDNYCNNLTVFINEQVINGADFVVTNSRMQLFTDQLVSTHGIGRGALHELRMLPGSLHVPILVSGDSRTIPVMLAWLLTGRLTRLLSGLLTSSLTRLLLLARRLRSRFLSWVLRAWLASGKRACRQE